MQLTVTEVLPQKSTTGKFYQKVTCSDGVTYSAWDDDFTQDRGKTVDVELVVKGTFKNIKKPKTDSPQQPTQTAAPAIKHEATDFEVRKTSVLCALEALEKMGEKVDKTSLTNKILWFEHYFLTGKLGTTENKE